MSVILSILFLLFTQASSLGLRHDQTREWTAADNTVLPFDFTTGTSLFEQPLTTIIRNTADIIALVFMVAIATMAICYCLS